MIGPCPTNPPSLLLIALHDPPVQTAVHISHFVAFGSPCGLICGVHWAAQWPCLTGRFPFERAPSVDWFGFFERIRASFVLPKSTEGHPLSPALRRPESANSTQNMLSLLYGPYFHLNISSFLFLFFLLLFFIISIPSSTHMLMRRQESRCTESKELWYFYGGWCWD